jgi:ATP-binding cassette subfamily B protein
MPDKPKKVNILSLLPRSIKELSVLDKTLLPLAVIGALLQAAHPFVNIIYTAKVVGELMGARAIDALVSYAVQAVLLNLALYVLKEIANAVFSSKSYPSLYFAEHHKAGKKLFSAPYARLEDSEFDKKARKYDESLKSHGSNMSGLSWATANIVQGIASFAAAFVVLVPLFKISFVRTGEGFLQSEYFALLVFGGIIVLVGLVYFINKKTQEAYFYLNDKYLTLSRIFNYYVDVVSDYNNGKEIRIFGEQELIERDAAAHLIENGVKIRKKVANATGMSTSIIAVIGAAAAFGVYSFIGIKGLSGAFAVDALVMYTGAFMIVVSSLTTIFSEIGRFASILRTIGYYFDLLDSEDEKNDGEKPEINGIEPPTVEFKSVSFKYPGSDNYALKDVGLTLTGGERLAVVGMNGSGKTTFIKLLTRMYDCYEGEILLNGKEIRLYSPEEYRKLFAVVFQDFKIFSFSAADNVDCGGAEDRQKIVKCLDDAGVGGRISRMPRGIDTYFYKDCDEDGVEISGGEAQKTAFARALYKDAPIIILDEPTASLDPVAEYEMYSRFNGLVGGKTAVYISHRLSSCRFCQKIAVFDSGSLIQYGSHEQLLTEARGKYKELWNAQSQYYTAN